MAFEQYIEPKKAFIFGLDDVLYPEKDYQLQVYYLFAEFMAYSMQLDAKVVLKFMQAEFMASGADGLFERTAKQFAIPLSYAENFRLLHQNARLPLKLLLYKQVLMFLQAIVVERKAIYLLVTGDPLQQLNKIKQLEWHGLEQYLKVYFVEETESKSISEMLAHMVDSNKLEKENLLYIGREAVCPKEIADFGVDYLFVTKLL